MDYHRCWTFDDQHKTFFYPTNNGMLLGLKLKMFVSLERDSWAQTWEVRMLMVQKQRLNSFQKTRPHPALRRHPQLENEALS